MITDCTSLSYYVVPAKFMLLSHSEDTQGVGLPWHPHSKILKANSLI